MPTEKATGSRVPAAQILLARIPRLLLKPKEAAAALGISPRLLWSLTRDETIPAIRLRNAVRYSPAALQQFIDRASNQ
jgi:hypothetical protein